MTVNTTVRSSGPFLGAGTAGPFPFAFKVFQAADVLLVHTDAAGVMSELLLGSDYIVSLNPDQNSFPGGSVMLSAPLAAGDFLDITSALTATQGLRLTNSGGFYPEAIENALDKLTILFQQFAAIGSIQGLRVPEIAGIPPLPVAADRAGHYLGFDGTGQPALLLASSGTAGAMALDLADATNPALGDALLGVKAAGTGAVGTTQHEVNARTLSVLDFMSPAQRADVLARTALLDVTAALQAAADAALASGARLIGCPGTALITGTLSLRCSGDLSELTLLANASTVTTAVRVGPTTGYLFDAELKLPFVINTAKTGTGWAGFTNSIGVEIANCYHCRFTVPRVEKFGIGLSMGGYSGVGCVYNRVEIGTLWNNRCNFEMKPKSTLGWCNQNLIFNGRLLHEVGEGVAVPGMRQILMAAQPGSTLGGPNNNTIINTCVEGDEAEFHLDVEGAYNRFENVRFETTALRGPAAIRFYSQVAGDTTANYIVGGYDSLGLTYTFAGASSPNNSRVGSKTHNAIDCSGSLLSLSNSSGGGEGAPHLQGFGSSTRPLGKGESSTDWTYRLYADGLSFKLAGDAYARTIINSSGFTYLGRGTVAPTAFIRSGNGDDIWCGAAFMPEADNTRTLGAASNRWSVVYAGNGAINTSDERAKQDIEDIPVGWLQAWGEVKWQRFRFRDAVQRKADKARWHVGLVAQRVRDAFEQRGLNAFDIGLLCFDEWDATPEEWGERDGQRVLLTPARPAGSTYGIRYDEALAMECAYIRWKSGM